MKIIFLLLPFLSLCFAEDFPSELLEKDTAWFSSAEGKEKIENVLSWQTAAGDWQKNHDNAADKYSGSGDKPEGTFDNGATTDELRFLAKAYNATKDKKCEAAFLLGLENILKAQYSNGGFPQAASAKGYAKHITFNDNAMLRLLQFLQQVGSDEEYAFVASSSRDKAKESVQKGIACVLKCQVIKEGKPTAWGAQHDEVTLKPIDARKYELASCSSAESAGLVRFLMKIPDPSPEIKNAIQGAVAWFEKTKLSGLRYDHHSDVRTLTKDDSAPFLWARFYDLETEKPIFCNRDGVKLFAYEKLDAERANGYAWYGSWGLTVAKEFTKWQSKQH